MAWVDYQKIRTGVPIDSVLAHYRIATRKVSNSQLKCDCPLASHKEAAHQKGTFSVSLDNGKWYCHADSCRAASGMPKGGDSIDLVRLLDGCTVLDAAKKLTEWFPSVAGANGGGKEIHSPPAESATKIQEPPLANPPLAFTLKDIQHTHPMLTERGITEFTAKEFGVGFFPGKGSMQNRIIFPIRDLHGPLIGYAGRTVGKITATNPKWLLPKNFHKELVLYGLEYCDPPEPLIIFEACWEVLKAYQQGSQAVALLGTTMSEEQERLLAHYPTLWLMLDDDDAGRKATEKLYERLKANHTVLKGRLRD